DIAVTATCVRVPVFIGHAEAVNVEFAQPISEERARAALRAAPGVVVLDHRLDEGYVTPAEAAGEDAVYVSRIRRAPNVTPARIPGQVLPPAGDVFLGRRITPLTRRRLDNFRANKRGFWSLWLFLALFVASLFAEFIANDRPLLVNYDGAYYYPVFRNYPETTFGGDFPTEADYRDPAVKKLIKDKGWMVWPLIP